MYKTAQTYYLVSQYTYFEQALTLLKSYKLINTTWKHIYKWFNYTFIKKEGLLPYKVVTNNNKYSKC